jgi:hypothetical protein
VADTGARVPSIVFRLTRRLDLELVCSKTPARDTLDVWPALPLLVDCTSHLPIKNADDVVAILERSNRVRQIKLSEDSSSRSHSQEVWVIG